MYSKECLVLLVALLSFQILVVGSFRLDSRARQISQFGSNDYDFISYNEDKDELKVRYSIIYPGTKWCGTGDIASNYDDLGEERATDMCCRAHDHCPDIIPAYQTKHGLKNEDMFTKLSCECDETFRKCLRATKTDSSDIVGFLYFDMLGTQCFSRKWWFWYGWYDVNNYED